MDHFSWGTGTMATHLGLIRQAAVVPLRDGQVCLVSSRSRKRWVTPKGCMEPGKTAGEVALQEAYEEAGLLGWLVQEPIGSYTYEKDGFLCYVIVFLLLVTDYVDDYPEATLRERVWLPVSQAPARIEDVGLRDLIRRAALSRAG
jgi:8-oxo-dGTP pyrophosphatase MutT (NUDIX family)